MFPAKWTIYLIVGLLSVSAQSCDNIIKMKNKRGKKRPQEQLFYPERIVGVRQKPEGFEYKIKWLGYGYEECSWETPERMYPDVSDPEASPTWRVLISDYQNRHPKTTIPTCDPPTEPPIEPPSQPPSEPLSEPKKRKLEAEVDEKQDKKRPLQRSSNNNHLKQARDKNGRFLKSSKSPSSSSKKQKTSTKKTTRRKGNDTLPRVGDAPIPSSEDDKPDISHVFGNKEDVTNEQRATQDEVVHSESSPEQQAKSDLVASGSHPVADFPSGDAHNRSTAPLVGIVMEPEQADIEVVASVHMDSTESPSLAPKHNDTVNPQQLVPYGQDDDSSSAVSTPPATTTHHKTKLDTNVFLAQEDAAVVLPVFNEQPNSDIGQSVVSPVLNKQPNSDIGQSSPVSAVDASIQIDSFLQNPPSNNDAGKDQCPESTPSNLVSTLVKDDFEPSENVDGELQESALDKPNSPTLLPPPSVVEAEAIILTNSSPHALEQIRLTLAPTVSAVSIQPKERRRKKDSAESKPKGKTNKDPVVARAPTPTGNPLRPLAPKILDRASTPQTLIGPHLPPSSELSADPNPPPIHRLSSTSIVATAVKSVSENSHSTRSNTDTRTTTDDSSMDKRPTDGPAHGQPVNYVHDRRERPPGPREMDMPAYYRDYPHRPEEYAMRPSHAVNPSYARQAPPIIGHTEYFLRRESIPDYYPHTVYGVPGQRVYEYEPRYLPFPGHREDLRYISPIEQLADGDGRLREYRTDIRRSSVSPRVEHPYPALVDPRSARSSYEGYSAPSSAHHRHSNSDSYNSRPYEYSNLPYRQQHPLPNGSISVERPSDWSSPIPHPPRLLPAGSSPRGLYEPTTHNSPKVPFPAAPLAAQRVASSSESQKRDGSSKGSQPK